MVKLNQPAGYILMESTTLNKPQVSSGFAQKELDKAEKQFEKFEKEVKDLTLDRMNAAPKLDQEPQTKISDREAQKADGIWLTPEKAIGPGVHPKTGEIEKFNEKFRADYNFKKEYVRFIAENKEIGGEAIE